jgi:hypothetical protein
MKIAEAVRSTVAMTLLGQPSRDRSARALNFDRSPKSNGISGFTAATASTFMAAPGTIGALSPSNLHGKQVSPQGAKVSPFAHCWDRKKSR